MKNKSILKKLKEKIDWNNATINTVAALGSGLVSVVLTDYLSKTFGTPTDITMFGTSALILFIVFVGLSIKK